MTATPLDDGATSLVQGPPASAFRRRAGTHKGAPSDYRFVTQFAQNADTFLAIRHGDGTNEPVVIKYLPAHLESDELALRAFDERARSFARVSHRNVGRILEIGEVQGSHFLAMEYIHGVTITEFMRRFSRVGGHLDIRVAVDVVVQLCTALSELFRQGQNIHGAVSADRVFIDGDGAVKLTGLAISGKWPAPRPDDGEHNRDYGYLSPEYLLDEPLDPRGDVYSAAVILWELIAGRPLFSNRHCREAVEATLTEPIPPVSMIRPAVPPVLCETIQRALSRRQRDRFADSRMFRRALEGAATLVSAATPPERIGALVLDMFADKLARRKHQLERCKERRRAGSASALHVAVEPVFS